MNYKKHYFQFNQLKKLIKQSYLKQIKYLFIQINMILNQDTYRIKKKLENKKQKIKLKNYEFVCQNCEFNVFQNNQVRIRSNNIKTFILVKELRRYDD